MALQASLSTGFSRQEYRSELPFPTAGYLPNPGMTLGSPQLQADSLPTEPPGKTHPCITVTHSLKTLKATALEIVLL